MKKIINIDLIKISISIILLVIGLILNNKILLVINYIFISIKIYINVFKNILKKGNLFDENTLMVIATLGAFYIGEFHEAVIVMLLFSIGEYLSDLAIESSKKSITELIDLRVDTINLKGVGKTDIKNAKIGDIFIVASGETIPLDGIILNGASHLDTSSLTGESQPCSVSNGNSILSGCINLEGTLEVKATSTYKTSTASKIIDLLEKSEDKKTNTEKFITKFSHIYTPSVVFLALLVIIIPTFLGLNFNIWLYRALEMLVISCPCALVISIPLGYFCGVGKCSKEGILVKGSNVLDELIDVNTIIFDKTGTITKGVFEVTKICSINKNDSELLELVATVEENSNHPVAMSVKKYYGKKISTKATNVKEIAGYGICANINEDKVIVGNRGLLEKMQINFDECTDFGTILYVAKNNKYIGYLVISDKIKNNVKVSLTKLKKLGVKNFIMLSGDNNVVVKNIAQKLNIDKYYGNLLPQDKVKILEEYQKKNKVAFVGDGINDAPVLKLANVGVSMGTIGSDAAIEASDIVIMNDDLEKLSDAVKISKSTRKIVMFNIYFAIIFKVLMLFFSITGKTSMWFAVFADVGVTILSIINSLRIFKKI